jgi:chromosomal replication initiation ATPase DnaA
LLLIYGTLNRKHHLRNKDPDLETIIQRIGDLLDMTREEVLVAGKNRRTVHARSILCYWAVESLGISMAGLSTRLDISVNAVGKSVTRGRTLAKR